MLFHNSSSDSDNSQDTAEVVSPAVVSTDYRSGRSVCRPFVQRYGKDGPSL